MGFENIEVLDRYDESGKLVISEDVVELTYRVLMDSELRGRMTRKNFQIGARFFGMNTLKTHLLELFDDYGDEIRASRKRIKKSKTLYSV